MAGSDSVTDLGDDSRRFRRDRVLGGIVSALFSAALGSLGVAIPLVALAAGYSVSQVGLLVALSAVSQLISRSFIGAMMRKLPDKFFVISAALLLMVSCGLIAISTITSAFVVAQLLQGVARAFFYTGAQTHAVRVSPSAVHGLTIINFTAGIGAFAGPVLAGLLAEHSVQLALTVGSAIGGLALILATLMVRLPPFGVAGKQPVQIWRRPSARTACWAGAASGIWRGLLDSYVPVMLALAMQSTSTIGLLISIANAAALMGSGLAGWARRAGIRRSLMIGILTAGLGSAAFGPLAGVTVAAGCLLVISGFGAGLLQTLGPATAADGVHSDEQGDAIATVGLFRASALFLAPLSVAGIVLVAPMGIAFLITAALGTLPALVSIRLKS